MSHPPQDGPGPQGGQPAQGGQPPHGPGAQGPDPQGHAPHGPAPQGFPLRQGPAPQGFPLRQGPGQPGYPGQQGPRPGFPPSQGRPGQPGSPQPGYPQPGYPQGHPYPAGPGQQGGGYGFAPGPDGQGPYQPGPSTPGPNLPGQPERKKRTGLLVLLGVGALALVLAVVAVVVNLGGGSETASSGTATSGAGGTAPSGSSTAPASTASDAVSGFLGALVQQDPAKALSYAADPHVDATLMTPAVLAASAKLAPIGNVQVPPVPDQDATSVTATYTLGSTPVSAAYDVVKVGTDWKISQVAAPVDVSAVMDSSIPMRVNGVRVRSGTLSLLPGAYRFTTGQRNYDYGKHPDLLVQTPSDLPDPSRLRPGISTKGRDSALRAVRSSWSRCLKSKDPKPGGCPNRWTNDRYRFTKGSVKWTRKGADPVKKPQSQLGFGSVTYRVKVDLTLKGRCTYKGQSGTCSGSLTGTALARVAVSAKKVKVSWV